MKNSNVQKNLCIYCYASTFKKKKKKKQTYLNPSFDHVKKKKKNITLHNNNHNRKTHLDTSLIHPIIIIFLSERKQKIHNFLYPLN